MSVTTQGPGPQVQPANQNPGNIVAHAQLESLFTTEVQKTGVAIQGMMQKFQENFQALADENTQLKERVSLLETDLRQERTLRAEERNNTLQAINSLKDLIGTKTASSNNVSYPQPVDWLPNYNPGFFLRFGPVNTEDNVKGIQDTRIKTNSELYRLYENQCNLTDTINEQAAEISRLKIQLAQSQLKA